MPMTDIADIWVYLSREPLLWLTATLAAYAIGDACFRAANRAPLVNPVLIAVVLLACLLWITGTTYQRYFEGAQFVHFLLGPATVALALPLTDALPRLRPVVLPVLAALVAGSVTAMGSALAIARWPPALPISASKLARWIMPPSLLNGRTVMGSDDASSACTSAAPRSAGIGCSTGSPSVLR